MKNLIPVLVGAAAIVAAITTAIASANHAFSGGLPALPYLVGYGVALLLLFIAAGIALTIRREQTNESAKSPISIHLENIGNPVHDQSKRQQIVAPPQSVIESKPRPTLELFDCKPGFIFYGNTAWCEADPSELDAKIHQPNACLAIFRNKPAPAGETGMPAYDVTAHLTYRNDKGEQQIVNFGTWVGKYEHLADFTRGESHALILSSSARAGKDKDGRVYVLDNPHSYNPFTRFRSGMTVYAPNEKPMLADCNEVEVSLICENITVYSGKLGRADESGDSTQFKQKP